MTASVSLSGAEGYRVASGPVPEKHPQSAYWLLATRGLLAVSIVIAIAGLGGYLAARNSVTHQATSNLHIIATLKATHLDHWLDEKQHEIRSVMHAEFARPRVAAPLQQWLSGGMHDDALRAGLLNNLHQMIEAHRYLEINLRSGQDGSLLLSSDGDAEKAASRDLARLSLRSGKTVLEDFYVENTGGSPRMVVGFIHPLRVGSDPQAVVAVEVTLDATEVLYPTIQQWPGWNISAETRLLRPDGDKVVMLNSLRQATDNVMSLGFTTPALADSIHATAMQVGTGALRGKDFYERPVFAYALPVPHTPWTLVAEVGEGDVYAKLNTIAALITAIVAVLMLSSGWWLLQQNRNAIARARHEAERDQLTLRMNYLAKYANDCIILCDASGHIMEANDRCLSTYGYSQDELLRMNLGDLHAAGTRSGVPQLLRQISQASGLILESEHERKDGTALDVEMSTSLMNVDGELCCQAIIRDVSERKKQQREREAHMQLLSSLACRLVNVQEEERRHLSGELHDQVGANLATMKLNLRSISRMLPTPDPTRLESMLAETWSLLTDTISSIRDYCADLRPAILDYSGLAPALEELVQRFGRNNGIVARFRQENMQERLPPQTESMLFRIVQEALMNCAKHSHATTVEVVMSRQDRKVVLTVSDDGVGFDPAHLGTRQVGMGLLTMSERAAMAGGQFSIIARPGKGTRISVTVEIQDDATNEMTATPDHKTVRRISTPSGAAVAHQPRNL